MARIALPYSLAILWRDPHRFLPALLAVAFSTVLIAVQCGLVLGLLQCVSAPIDHSKAELWIMTADAASLPQACPIPELWRWRVDLQPEVVRTESYLLGTGLWHKPKRGSAELCFIIGFDVGPDSLGLIDAVTPDMRNRLTEPGAIVVDEWDLENLGLKRGVGETAEINQQRVRVVGVVHGFLGHNFIFTFCSRQTARQLLPNFQQQPDTTLCVLARCRQPGQAAEVARRLRQQYPEMGVYTREDLSFRVRRYWLFRSTGGTVMVCTVALSLLVGLVVTSQVLSAAVVASLREYAVLDALGIPRWRLACLVLAKSYWIGAGGVLLAVPITYLLSAFALLFRTRILLPAELLLTACFLTLAMALVSGVAALRTLRQVEPVTLLR